MRDFGLLDSAVVRPRSTVYGIDAYPDVLTKAAALLDSLVRNHPLVDGNKRTAWAAAWTFLGLNGIELDPNFDVDAAEALMYQVAASGVELAAIADALRGFSAAQ